MTNIVFHEQKKRGSFAFPIEYYFVDRFHPRYEMPFHWHTEYELIAVTSGNFRMVADGEELLLSAGECAILQGGAIHGGAPEGAVYECLVFDLQGLLDSSEMSIRVCEILDSGRLTQKLECDSEIAATIFKMISAMRERRIGYELAVKGLIYQLLSLLISGELLSEKIDPNSPEYKKIRILKNILKHIHKNYNEPLNLTILANTANMSPKYFCRFFKELVGKTPIDYLNFYRIERACEMLISGEKNITETAFECGFNDISYFIKTFKKYKGIPPKQYMSSIKK